MKMLPKLKFQLYALPIMFAASQCYAADDSGDVAITGILTYGSCAYTVEVAGSPTSSIDLGTIQVGNQGTAVDFNIVPATGCLNNNATVSISYAFDNTDSMPGHITSTGSASDAYALFEVQESNGSYTAATPGTPYIVYDGSSTAPVAFPQRLQLIGGSVGGTYTGHLSFAVSYQ